MRMRTARYAAILLAGLLLTSTTWDATRPGRVNPTLPGGGWLSAVQDNIRRAEYDVTWQDRTYLPDLPAAYQAPNRAHNLRTYFTPNGIRMIPRTTSGSSPEWEWGLRLVRYGFEGDLRPVAQVRPVAKGNRVEYTRHRITEWYVNDEQGLEQGFTLEAPPEDPSSESWIHIELSFSGALTASASEDGKTIEFVTPGGVSVLLYGKLRAIDAAGNLLAANMIVNGSSIRLRVDAAAAAYPVTVDPLTTSPSWTAESDQAGSNFGNSIATAGDVNADGYADVIIGASGYDNGQADEGRSFAYYGSATGLSASPSWTAESDRDSALFGYSLHTAGDVNGDGYADVIVGAPGYTGLQPGSHEEAEGAVFVYHGSASGLSSAASWMDESDRWHGGLGAAVSTAGDVNGDGYADVIIGAPSYDPGSHDPHGRIFAYYGSASGLSPQPVWIVDGDQSSAGFGGSVGTAGDVNGDGYSDVVVGVPNHNGGDGRAIAFYGSSTGLGPTPNWIVDNNRDFAVFGLSVGTAGDVNGDGYADVIVGAPYYRGDLVGEGRAFVYHGSASGLSQVANWIVEGNQVSAYFGYSVGTAGDTNGDGYADVIVAASAFDNDQADEGRAYVYLGSAGGLSTSATWTVETNQASAQLTDVAAAGDVDGNGYSDVLVATPNYDDGLTNVGRAFLYVGSPAGLSASAAWMAESNQASAQLGSSAATAGDVNGDGYADLIVGAPGYDNGQVDEGRVFVYHGSAIGPPSGASWTAEGNQPGARFGSSASTAGDVNGDGYADVVIGAPFYDNGQVDEGRTVVYHGSAAGLKATVNWKVESNQVGAQFGASVGSAGDVNGDGYGDVLVGSPLFNSGQVDEGRAFLYRGSSSGLSTGAAWTAESNQADARFGSSVGTAGDVNRDGYSDVVIGAPLYDNGQTDEGRVYVYHGLPSGLTGAPTWMVEGNQAGARFGSSAATAGDVNSDGYSDVIVGAPLYDNSPANEGRAYVYHGSASGLKTTPNWKAESNQAGAQFGISVGTAGDVNGDGFADVIVGAPLYDNGHIDEGRTYVYLGALSGLSAGSKWTAESNQAGAQFGASVTSAGDVNGDGYADAIVGAPAFDNGQTDEGRAYLFYGNDGLGVSLRPRQRRANNSGPIAHLGKSNSSTAFGLALLGRTPFGRGKIKLEVEVKPLGTPFNGLGTVQTLSWQDTGVAGVELFRLVSGLSPATPYHWRVRVLYHPAQLPFQQRSRWLTMPWNGWNEKDLRTY
jgi:hypothetical protein